MGSKVYFMGDRAQSVETSMVPKMITVFEATGYQKRIKTGDIVAIKIHCGEFNNTSYLRPVYARAMADYVKALGGRPFVCDTTTLPYYFSASRTTALDEMLTAERNGYNSGTLNCPFIVADGFMGTDDIRVDVPEGYICKEAYIAKAIAVADHLITISHFKGHAMGVIGGTIKNLGIGCQSKRGKHNIHMGGHPQYGMINSPVSEQMCDGEDCPMFELCKSVCPYDLITFSKVNGKMTFHWDQSKCTNCLACLGCIMQCFSVGLADDTWEAQDSAMADGALGVIKAVGKDNCCFINMAIDIAPGCDCMPWSDSAMVPNIGVLASLDPVAIDQACLEKANSLAGMPGSVAEERSVAAPGTKGRFSAASSMMGISENLQINAGVKNGLGSKEYELVEVPPGNPDKFQFGFDPRPIGLRLRNLYKKDPVYPYEKGFKRLNDVNFEEVR